MARFACPSVVNKITLLALRFGIAAGILVAVALARGETWPRGKTLATLIGLGAFGYGGQAFTFFTALTLAPAGLVALLLYLYPALVAVLSASLLHERLSAAKLLALAVALVGTVLTIGPASSASPLGVALGIAAAAIYAVYIVAGSRLTARVPPQTMATVVIAAAGAVFLVATLMRGPTWPRTPTGWLAVLGIAIVSTVAAIVLFFAGLERVGPTRAAACLLHAQVENGTQCPLTMTYASVPVLRRHAGAFPLLSTDWLPKIVERDYDRRLLPIAAKTSALIGMGMTERQGGSDVRANVTRAERTGDGSYRLSGHKWFFSAPMCDAHLVLAQADVGLS